jgi:cytochrome P450/NADPH-cytochrome P450 reductase
MCVHAHAGSLAGVNYAVFGVGNSQWAQTFQAFPKKVDVQLKAAGAHQVGTGAHHT